MGKYKNLAKNTLYVSIGTAGSKIVGILMLPLYTRWLSVDEFGTTDAITIYSTLLVGVLSLCISESIFVFPKNQAKYIQEFYYSSGLTFCFFQISVGALLFLLLNWLFNYFKFENIFSTYSWYIYGLLSASFLQSFTQSFTRSLDKMFIYSMAGMIQTIGIAIFSFLLIPYIGLRGYVLSFIISYLISSIFAIISANHLLFFSLKKVKVGKIKEMLKYSTPLIPNNIMWWLINGLNRPIMEIYLSTFSLGIYAVANKFSTMLQSVFSIFGMSWFNSALDEFGNPEFEKFYNNCLKIISTFLFLLSFIIIILSEQLIKLLTTEDYYIAYRYIPFLLLSIIFSCLSGVIGCLFACVKKSRYYFYSSMFGGIGSITSLLLLTPLLGLYGVVLSVLLSHTLMLFFTIFYSLRFAVIRNVNYYFILLLIYFILTLNNLYANNYTIFINIILFSIFVMICRDNIKSIYILAQNIIRKESTRF